MQEQVKAKAIALLTEGVCDRVLGWKAGEFFYDVTPAVFTSPEQVEREFVFGPFCGANLSKYLIQESRKGGKVGAFLKPCDSYSFAQLLKEHRIWRENTYIVGIPCQGMCDMDVLRSRGCKGIRQVAEDGEDLVIQTLYGQRTLPRRDALAERCLCCKSKKIVLCDERMGPDGPEDPNTRMEGVRRLEAMTPQQRYDFWRGELSRCIRCNACRNVCPACSCEKCVFDDPASGVENKAAADSFEENLFHIIRAFHVAGRCTDCGECSRVCPQHIPLHLLNRKLIQDINTHYGAYQAGADPDTRPPLVSFSPEDPEPSVVYRGGGKA